jgi:hypothetical protein
MDFTVRINPKQLDRIQIRRARRTAATQSLVTASQGSSLGNTDGTAGLSNSVPSRKRAARLIAETAIKRVRRDEASAPQVSTTVASGSDVTDAAPPEDNGGSA